MTVCTVTKKTLIEIFTRKNIFQIMDFHFMCGSSVELCTQSDNFTRPHDIVESDKYAGKKGQGMCSESSKSLDECKVMKSKRVKKRNSYDENVVPGPDYSDLEKYEDISFTKTSSCGQGNMIKHKSKVHATSKVKCHLCGKMIKHMRDHINTVHKLIKQKCHVCGKMFRLLERHNDQVHSNTRIRLHLHSTSQRVQETQDEVSSRFFR